MNLFEQYNHLGFHNPYYIIKDNKFKIFQTFDESVDSFRQIELDTTSIYEILNRGYIFGDKTIIKGLYKTPWMAKPNCSSIDWDYYKIEISTLHNDSVENLASKFYQLLKEEILLYVGGKESIGILLTGGMDSRIVACVLNDLVTEKIINPKKILAMTWGSMQSRDIQYSKRIAELFNWDWKRIIVDVDQMKENISTCVTNGCEFTPLHIHGMSQVSRESSLDCILAGSFGDSIGRGEYSSVKVENLQPINLGMKNIMGLLLKKPYISAKSDSCSEIDRYHKLFPQKEKFQIYELDQQLHYMRRMLNPCMAIINRKIPLYQVFTSPKVYEFIWSVNPQLRNDDIYYQLLKKNNHKLLDIPWARTGLTFPNSQGIPDSYLKNHHNYGEMIRTHFMNEIQDQINTTKFKNLNIFDIDAINALIKWCTFNPIKNSYFYEERLIWLSSVSKLVSKFNSIIPESPSKQDISSRYYGKLEYYTKLILKSFLSR